MKPGDTLYHKNSGKQLTVKRVGDGNGMVLCSWMEPKRGGADGEMLECQAAFSWLDLSAIRPIEPAPAEPDEPVEPKHAEPAHKHKRQ